jgi:hypothetical protein
LGPRAFATPLQADVVDGEVVLTAPDAATAVSLTPEAALETAERLREAARSAYDARPFSAND